MIDQSGTSWPILHIGFCTVCKKTNIIINYMLILLYFLGGLMIAAKILALVRSPGHT